MPSCLMRGVMAFICACVQTKHHSTTSRTAQMRGGLKQTHVTVLVQCVSFVEVLLAAGIIDIGRHGLQYTTPHT